MNATSCSYLHSFHYASMKRIMYQQLRKSTSYFNESFVKKDAFTFIRMIKVKWLVEFSEQGFG